MLIVAAVRAALTLALTGNNGMYWANFLHIYQPPNQKKYWVDKVTEESYRRIITELEAVPEAKLTLNINGCLLELWHRYGHDDVIRRLRALVERGQVELTSSAKYHPFLPKLPATEVIRQIELNAQTFRRFFGKRFAPKGFFPPEMAFTPALARIVARCGFEWIIADEAAYPHEHLNPTVIHTVQGTRMAIFFRERATSFKILSAQLGTGSLFLRDLGDRLQRNEYLLTAMDGETFGHHRLGLEKLLFDIYRSKELKTVTVSELLPLFSERTAVKPLSSSWALMHKDLAQKAPFIRWDDRSNAIHRTQWQLTFLAIRAIQHVRPTVFGYRRARTLLDGALHSDQYWWASAKPWWSLENIEAGAYDLLTAIRAMPNVSKIVTSRAKELYDRIVHLGFRWQRAGIVDALVKEHYDEEVSERLDTTAPTMEPEEFERIVTHLRAQMHESAKQEEYERAAQFSRRIKELTVQRKQEEGHKRHFVRHPKKDEEEKEWGL